MITYDNCITNARINYDYRVIISNQNEQVIIRITEKYKNANQIIWHIYMIMIRKMNS